jgi:hypothetical protein
MKEHNDRAIRIEATLIAVLEQAKKTNGRVTKVEDKQQLFEEFKTRAMVVWGGAITIIGVIINKII